MDRAEAFVMATDAIRKKQGKPPFGSSAQAAPDNRGASQLVRSGSLVGAPRRPLKRDAWTRGFVCAVAKLIEMHGRVTEADELFRLAGKRDHILKHADEEDIETLRSAGLL